MLPHVRKMSPDFFNVISEKDIITFLNFNQIEKIIYFSLNKTFSVVFNMPNKIQNKIHIKYNTT